MRMRRHNMARVTIKAPYPVCLFFYFFCSLVIRSFRPTFQICVPATAISGRQHLRSAATSTLLVPRARTATGQRSFAVNGPTTRNRLPPALRSPDLSESAFKRALKTHLFSTAQRHWDVFVILAPDINIQTHLLTYFFVNFLFGPMQ